MSVKRWNLFWSAILLLFLGKSGLAVDSLRVAVLDFRNNTNQSELNYLEIAIPVVLITDLSICEKITLVERARLQEILDEMQLALSGVVNDKQVTEIGELAGANAILVGDITSAGNTFRIDARLVDVKTGKVLLAEKKNWLSEDEILLAVDELAQQIIRKLTGENVIVNIENPGMEPISIIEDNVLKIETALDQPVWLNGSGESVFLQVDIYSKEVPKRERIPLNLALVIDRSGSMASERKLDYVKESAKFIVENLDDNDIISLITYESGVQLVVPAQTAQQKRKIINLIDDITSGGSTNLSGGMLEGYSQVQKNQKTGQVDRVLLLSDGLANEGITRADKLSEICYEKSLQGMSISTFGVGADYDEDLLLGLAELGVGNYYFIYSPEEIPTIFATEMSGLLAVAAQNVKIRVQTPPNVKVKDVSGYLFETKNNITEITIGDIFSNDHYSMTFEMQLPDRIPDSLRLAEVVLQYDDVVNKGDRISSSTPVIIRSTDEPGIREYYRNPYVGERLTLLNSSHEVQMIVQRANESNIGEVRQSLENQAVRVSNSATQYKSAELKKQILNIYKYSEQFAEVEKNAEENERYNSTTSMDALSSKVTSTARTSLESLKKEAKYNSYNVQKKNEVLPAKIRKNQSKTDDNTNTSVENEPIPKPTPLPDPIPAPVPVIKREVEKESKTTETKKVESPKTNVKTEPETIKTRNSKVTDNVKKSQSRDVKTETKKVKKPVIKEAVKQPDSTTKDVQTTPEKADVKAVDKKTVEKESKTE